MFTIILLGTDKIKMSFCVTSLLIITGESSPGMKNMSLLSRATYYELPGVLISSPAWDSV